MKMKRYLLSILLLLYVCSPFVVFSQEIKDKPVINDTERVVFEMNVVGNKIFTENAPIGRRIEVYSVIGLKINEIEIKTPSGEYILNVPKGYYILKLNDTVRKVAIR